MLSYSINVQLFRNKPETETETEMEEGREGKNRRITVRGTTILRSLTEGPRICL